MKASLRIDEVATHISVSKRTVYRWKKKGLLSINNRGRVVSTPFSYSDDELLKPLFVAKTLKVSIGTIYRWFHEGVLQGVQFNGRTLRIKKSAVDELLKEGES